MHNPAPILENATHTNGSPNLDQKTRPYNNNNNKKKKKKENKKRELAK